MRLENAVNVLRRFAGFVRGSATIARQGGRAYWMWLAFLCAGIVSGALAYANQLRVGLAVTAMRDPVSWGFYIGNFTFLVGVAAAAVVLVIPAYVYDWKPIKEIALIGELLAITAILMCMMFVTVDVGNPLRVWHMIPLLGSPNFPRSLLAWDVVVLTLYLTLNLVIATHILYRSHRNQHYNKRFAVPL